MAGPCENVVTACAASTHAIANAARLIAYGRCDAVLAGGSEAAMTEVGIQGFINMTAISSLGISRPFDVERDGFVIAEGAAVLVLEEWEAAHARGAHIYGEIMGGASTADAHHITAPSPGGAGAIACIELALAEAEISPAEIRQINAHGTSTPLNDAAEAEAIEKVFGTPGPAGHVDEGRHRPRARCGGRASRRPRCCSRCERKLIPPTAGFTKSDPDDAHRRRARRAAAMGAGADTLELVRLRRPQRLPRDRPCRLAASRGTSQPASTTTKSSSASHAT